MHALAPLTAPADPPPSGMAAFAEVEALGERIAELSAQIQAATYQLLVMIREFDERNGWSEGFRSCAHWLNWRAGLDLGAAREKVRVARTLAELPRISASMRQGEISYSKVRAMTRVATAANEEELLLFARAGTAHHVERLVRAWRRVDRIEEMEHEEKRQASRSLTAYTDEDGMVVVRGRLTPEAGAALLRALDAAGEKLYEVRRGRLACDAAKVVMTHGADGSVLDVGRRTRTVPPALRRALAHRDQGCRFPGCGLKLCDAHHVEHWADGGATKLHNLVQLCRRHHRAVHEEGFTEELTAGGEARFRRPGGRVIEEAPALPTLSGDAGATLRRRLARRSIHVDAAESLPSWEGGPADYNWAIQHMRGLVAADA